MATTVRLTRAAALVLGIVLCFAIPGRTLSQAKGAPTTAGPTAALPAAATTLSGLSASSAIATPSTILPRKKEIAAGRPIDADTIIAHLTAVINWHRRIDLEVRASSEAEETLFATDDRRMADEILKLAFDFARAAEQLPGVSGEASNAGRPTPQSKQAATGPSGEEAAVSPLDDLIKRRAQMQQRLDILNNEGAGLRQSLRTANHNVHDSIARQAAANQEQIDLVKSRISSLDNLIDFEKGMGVTNRGSTLPLDAQIDALQQSVSNTAKVTTPTQPNAPNSSVVPGMERLLELRQKGQAISTAIDLTGGLAESVNGLRETLIKMMEETDREGRSEASKVGSLDLPTVEKTKAQFAALVASSQLISNALVTLEKQLVLLQLYSGNLERWQESVNQRFNEALRSQLLSLASLGLVLGVVLAAAAAWRHLTIRYVEDLQRRQKLLQLRRAVVIFVVFVILLVAFSSQLKTLATVMGFAAAGIALALQNVIVSIAGYFYLSGRFGIRAGDRVQISGITGDVLEISFFKMTLMELGGEDRRKLPTGRAVIFPNSVVFQPNSNFFRQLPGTSFSWSELTLTLAPDCDYRQAEQLVTEVINDVFARYRDTVQREYRTMAVVLNLPIETPRPQSRLQIGAAGLEMVVRYPTRITGAAQAADEITRRLIDAIKRDPNLKLAVPGVPSIQAEIEAPTSADELRAASAPTNDSASSGDSAQTIGAPPGKAVRTVETLTSRCGQSKPD